jgi:Cdc6-like AAA superfamily ATPase
MIKVICGKKGVGKTRVLVDSSNSLVEICSGVVVFIDGNSRSKLMYELNYKIRFINISEFPVKMNSSCVFLGFLCGIISANYDVNGIFIDDITRIVGNDVDELKKLFEGVKEISDKYNIDFSISIEGDPNSMPEFIKQYF